MNETFLILSAALILAYGLISAVAEKSILTPHMVFMLAGVLFSPLGLDLIDLKPNTPSVVLLATVALVIILAADASQADKKVLRKASSLPVRLLFIGLPLTILSGIGIGMLTFPSLGFASVIFLALVLAPTDAALGQAVISNEAVPVKIREALNVESGLNDGICLPAIFAVLYYMGAEVEGGSENTNWLGFAAKQILLGPVAGAIVGIGGGKLIDASANRGWIDVGLQRLLLPALALLAYTLAEAIGGNGFIGAFFAGFTLLVKDQSVRKATQNFSESEGSILSLLTFLILGLVMIPDTIDHWNLHTTIYALLSLTVIRMVPVALCLTGCKLDWRTLLFMGWFGPRGIASILYLLMLIDSLGAKGYETVIATGIQTIVFSVILHGITAAPLAKKYGGHEANTEPSA